MSEQEIKKSSKKGRSLKEVWTWSNIRAVTGSNLSKLSKAFLLPIALLPIAGVFLGVGATIAANTSEYTAGWYIGKTMNTMGDVAFGNLPILFAVSVAIAYTDDSGVAAITAIVGFLVMNGIQAALLKQNDVYDWAWKVGQDNKTAGEAWQSGFVWDNEGDGGWKQLVSSSYSILWWNGVPAGLITSNVGITSLNTGVFASIFVGAISAIMYNKFHKTQLPAFISFFSGSKLVPIITFFAVIPLSFIFIFIWPAVGKGLEWFGTNSGKLPIGADSLIYEVIERSLIPFGLHHVFYAPLWWSSAGGSIIDTLEKAYENGQTTIGSNGANIEDVIRYLKGLEDKSQLIGDQYMMYWVLGAKNKLSALGGIYENSTEPLLNFDDLAQMGLNLGRFQSGKFGFMLFGLPAAGIAMWLNVPKENRKSVMGIYFSAAFTSFLTGITEPIEFTFLFLAPWLFYGVHMPLAAIAFMLAGFAKVHVSMTVSGGMIDYIVFGLIPFYLKTNAHWAIVIGLGMAPIYFFAFYFAVKYGKVQVPGRAGEVKLFTKSDFKSKKENKDQDGGNKQAAVIKATKIIEYLGGESNIKSVDSCASRLRVTVIDASIVDKQGIMSLGGATGIIAKGTNVQVVYGGEQEVIKPHMKELLTKLRSENK
ncbi:PTS transporter subunit EIIC [Spiroplasma turonicum]|uniref:PTS system glucose-specific IIBC component n=1 Tax=Spiroplasma turonicum TaxID=216946 RepID=A0A0K1P6U6_9MOLU|nr:PTS transporter subunit EIIC [Spiroplasma turonicum]AKU80031.1 PTS system glucose-specific IIBC component [Spiroplasma turonicum]ALX71033.1 PTS system, glucose-specific IIBC component [Spiroplasma turonicum]